jgi:pimeloyl-ACP methyl ester carboxylesterase
MPAVSLRRLTISFGVLLLAVAGACTRLPPVEQTTVKVNTVGELQDYLRTHKADLDLFRLRGPFAVTERTDHELRLGPREAFYGDLYLSAAAERAPLVVFVHGYDSSKEAHANQAMHAASWGMHALSVQLPKRGPWVTNGRLLTRIVNHVRRSPDSVDPRVDPNRIVLVGHSFGAAAVAIALGEGAPAVGGVLLDPAAVGRDLPKILQQINKPVMIIGADEQVGSTRNREFFYRYVRSGVAEVSIKDATHEDAQYPSEYSLRNYGSDPYTTEELQIAFAAALTSAAMSLASTGGLDYAWTSYAPVLQSGKFYNAKRK